MGGDRRARGRRSEVGSRREGAEEGTVLLGNPKGAKKKIPSGNVTVPFCRFGSLNFAWDLGSGIWDFRRERDVRSLRSIEKGSERFEGSRRDRGGNAGEAFLVLKVVD